MSSSVQPGAKPRQKMLSLGGGVRSGWAPTSQSANLRGCAAKDIGCGWPGCERTLRVTLYFLAAQELQVCYTLQQGAWESWAGTPVCHILMPSAV
eukprot:scaffold207842_cov16-Tisochrysis_lutea.AAC.1